MSKSIGQLLNLLPVQLTYDGDVINFVLKKSLAGWECYAESATDTDIESTEEDDRDDLSFTHADPQIALQLMIEYLVEEGYIDKHNQKK